MDEPALEVENFKELLVRSMHLHVDALAFDRELSPSQLRNIATATDLKVLDRTQLILDIFAQRATSREGKLKWNWRNFDIGCLDWRSCLPLCLASPVELGVVDPEKPN